MRLPTLFTLEDLAAYTGRSRYQLRRLQERGTLVPMAATWSGSPLFSEVTALNARLDALLELQLKSAVLGERVPGLDDKIAELRVLTDRIIDQPRREVRR